MLAVLDNVTYVHRARKMSCTCYSNVKGRRRCGGFWDCKSNGRGGDLLLRITVAGFDCKLGYTNWGRIRKKEELGFVSPPVR